MAWYIPLIMAGAADMQRRAQDPNDDSILGKASKRMHPEWLFGRNDGEAERGQRDYLERGVRAIENLEVPELQDIVLENLEKYKYAGDINPSLLDTDAITELMREYDPERMQAVAQGDTAYKDIMLDPRFRDEQIESLDAYQDIIDSGGFRLADEAAINEAMMQAGMADRGRREAINQTMANRGMSGSGMDMLAQMQSGQNASMMDNQESLNRAAMAQDRVLQSILASGDLAGSMERAEWGRKSDEARAADAIARFNVANQMRANEVNAQAQNSLKGQNYRDMIEAMRFNAQAQNTANRYNRDARQDYYDRNTELANMVNVYNVNDRLKDQFDMERSKARDLAGAYGGMSDYFGDEAARRATMRENRMSGLFKAGAQGADMFMRYKSNQPRQQARQQARRTTMGGPDGTSFYDPYRRGEDHDVTGMF